MKLKKKKKKGERTYISTTLDPLIKNT
jgi:hypothetical protein